MLREDCNEATIEEWEEAVDWNFKINNWPYVNAESEDVRACYSQMDKFSLENLQRDEATNQHILKTFASVLLLAT